MYSIEIKGQKVSFNTKKEANSFVLKNTVKRGRDYFSKTDLSVEFHKLY